MKPVFQKLTGATDEGFVCKVVRGRGFDCPWHFHSECELILVLQSGGYRLLGDHLAPLAPGDMVFVGPDLPHIYQNDEAPAGRAPPVHAILVQFDEDWLGEGLARLPALAPVRRLMRRARLGLQVTGATRDHVAELMREMIRAGGLRRVVLLIEVLEALADSTECRTLASAGFAGESNLFDQERMNRVCRYINERLDRTICLGELARLVHLSEGAFSRFFRAHTSRTFPEFVNELRVGRACRLLAETEMPVTEIAFASGFENLSNFNRQFRRLKGTTPRAFRRALAAGHLGV